MSSLIPETTPGQWNQQILAGATWPSTTIMMTRDGVDVIPVSASLLFHDPDGTLVLTIAATIGGSGLMTIPGLSAAATAALTFTYANTVLRITESGSVVTDLLAGNATVVNRGD